MTTTFRGKGGRGVKVNIENTKITTENISISVSYKSNKGIRLTRLSKQYFVPHWPKSGGQFFFARSTHKIVPNFQNRGAAHENNVCIARGAVG